MSGLSVELLPQRRDNYAYLLRVDAHVVVVDPAEPDGFRARLSALGLPLGEIWLTHHHADHSAGAAALLAAYPQATVRAHPLDLARLTFPPRQCTPTVQGFAWAGLAIEVIHNPGHTHGAVSFVVPGPPAQAALDSPEIPAQPGAVIPTDGGVLFSGDTLFTAGCGRLFEGNAATLAASLRTLAALAPTLRVLCGHEYTETNLRFARVAWPDNPDVIARQLATAIHRAAGHATVGTRLALERATNPFVRTDVPAVRAAVVARGDKADTDDTVFAALRTWKDGFAG